MRKGGLPNQRRSCPGHALYTLVHTTAVATNQPRKSGLRYAAYTNTRCLKNSVPQSSVLKELYALPENPGIAGLQPGLRFELGHSLEIWILSLVMWSLRHAHHPQSSPKPNQRPCGLPAKFAAILRIFPQPIPLNPLEIRRFQIFPHATPALPPSPRRCRTQIHAVSKNPVRFVG